MRCLFVTLITALALGLAFRGVEREVVHVCDTIVVTMPVTDTITEYICMTEWGPHQCGFDPVAAALMMQAN